MFPESQFVFDLELPVEFRPRVGDGEVQDFCLLPLEKVGFFLVYSNIQTSREATLKLCDASPVSGEGTAAHR